jgi:hypothetical protein
MVPSFLMLIWAIWPEGEGVTVFRKPRTLYHWTRYDHPEYYSLQSQQTINVLVHLWSSVIIKKKGKAFPLQAWSGPEGSRKLRFPDYMTTAQDGGKVVNLTLRPTLPPGNAPGTHFCSRLSRPQGHSAIGRIMSMENFSNTIWNRTSVLPICSKVP